MVKEDKTSDSRNNKISRREAIGSFAAMSAGAVVPGMAFNRGNQTTPNEESSSMPVHPPVYSLNRPGNSRQFTTFDRETKEKAYPIQPGERKELVNYKGAGIISRLWMTISGWFWMYWEPETYTDPTILKKLILRIYWDGKDYPSVEAPIGDFLASATVNTSNIFQNILACPAGAFIIISRCRLKMAFV